MKKSSTLALLVAFVSAPTLADSLLYGGAMIGQSDYKDESSTSTEIHIGTGILPFIGIEGGFIDHGEFEFDSSIEADARSVFAAIRPSVNFGPLHIYSRVGLHRWDLTENSVDDDGVDIMYGVGLEYFTAGPLALGAGYNVYKMDDEDISTFSVTATFHFF